MQDPANDLLPPPSSSPTISSVSSSDLDTESTGSFFHDRSTTLGTLMGVSFPAVTFRAPSQSRDGHVTANAAGGGASGTRSKNKNKNKKKKRGVAAPDVSSARRRWRWWRMCSDDCDAKPASLGEFLEVERRFGDSAFFEAAADELEGVVVVRAEEEQPPRNGRVLFADGRVLPPAPSDGGDDDDETSSTAEVLCNFPVSITNICR
ncbi:hypothetical protein LWI29_007139 [Acer saccharum]|uniref:Uncharacterized protein n=1 Tax=Acer saccharum TaxID=4024 RepID=A0AA39VQ82_ACESA|nr:hypothetical protein LWI29_007139 [Acer saccharum]